MADTIGSMVNALRSGGRPRDLMEVNRFGMPERSPYQSELDYFQKNTHVPGMAADDGQVVMNPYSSLSFPEQDAVRMNESARLLMRGGFMRPQFSLTPQQQQFLANTPYGSANDADRRETIAARLLSGDPSAGVGTAEQMEYVRQLRNALLRGR